MSSGKKMGSSGEDEWNKPFNRGDVLLVLLT